MGGRELFLCITTLVVTGSTGALADITCPACFGKSTWVITAVAGIGVGKVLF